MQGGITQRVLLLRRQDSPGDRMFPGEQLVEGHEGYVEVEEVVRKGGEGVLVCGVLESSEGQQEEVLPRVGNLWSTATYG